MAPGNLPQEVIEERQKQIRIFESVRNAPDIIEYRQRRRARRDKASGRSNSMRAASVRAKVVKAVRHRVVLAVTNGATSMKEVSRKLDIPVSSVRAVIADRGFDKHLTTYQKGVLAQARYKLEEKADAAVIKLCQIMEKGKPNQKIQLDAVRDLLDRIGLKPREIIETISRQYTPEETTSMLNTSKEVEAITKRLTVSKSPFLVDKAKPPEPEKVPDAVRAS